LGGPIGRIFRLDPLVLVDENYWHPVTDVTQDNVDALNVVTPVEDGFFASLIAEFQGPVRISFWSKTTTLGTSAELLYFINHTDGSPITRSKNLPKANVWVKNEITMREAVQMKLYINLNDTTVGSHQAWLDNFEIKHEFPPNITKLPEYFPVPLGKVSKLEVEADGFGTITYKWFRDGVEIPGETEASISIPAASESGQFNYKVDVTDQLGSTLSNSALVEFFDLSEVLDNDLLEFTIPDLPSQNYSGMLLTGSDAPDGEDALYLSLSGGDTATWTNTVSTVIEGPAIVSYLNREAITRYFLIDSSGPESVEWSATSGPFGPIPRILDQVKLSQKPVLFQSPEKQTTVVGLDRMLVYDFMSVGETTQQLLKSGQVIVESENQPINLQSLGLNQDGFYQLRISNEFGEEVLSDPFQIEIHDTIGDSVEQPNLVWTYDGEKIWIPQIFETYDGEDAAGLLDEGEGTGTVSTQVVGPSLVSFWHKNSSVRINDEIVELNSDSEWQKTEIALAAATNELKWSNGFFDRLQIEHVEPIGNAVEQPDLQWTYDGNRIWIPQTEESFDGEDAAKLQTDGSGFGTVATEIPGPALVSFWWKDATDFDIDGNTISYEGDDWQQVQVVGWSETNTLQWHSGLFDQLEIEDLRNDPFRRWPFGNFPLDDVVNNLDDLSTSDPDFDTFSNLLEWALNKNKDFPNNALAYKVIEEDGEKYLGLTFSRPADLGEFSIHLEATDNLNTWTRIDSVISETFNEINNTYTVTIRDIQPLGTGGRFIRLVVTDE